jgi:hypothetical protein
VFCFFPACAAFDFAHGYILFTAFAVWRKVSPLRKIIHFVNDLAPVEMTGWGAGGSGRWLERADRSVRPTFFGHLALLFWELGDLEFIFC